MGHGIDGLSDVKGFQAPSPLVVFGIGLTIAIVNVLTVRPPAGPNPAGYLIGYLLAPIIIGVLYWVWWRRRHPPST